MTRDCTVNMCLPRPRRILKKKLLCFSAWVGSQETVLVRLTLITGQGSYQDFITFSAISSEVTTKQVIVDVGTQREDNHDPKLYYQFTSDCVGVTSCEDGSWTVEVKVKDTDSGKKLGYS